MEAIFDNNPEFEDMSENRGNKTRFHGKRVVPYRLSSASVL